MIKALLLFLLLTTAPALLISGCEKQPAGPEQTETTPSGQAELPDDAAPGQAEISFNYSHRSGIASNQFAVWIENGDGAFVKTLYATRFTATKGWKSRPDALSVWVARSGLSDDTEVDAFTGATPKSGQLNYSWDCRDAEGQPVPAGDYHFLVEGTIFWQDAVLYDGVITVGGGENTAQAAAAYTTEEAKKSDMITGVEAVYKPQ